MADEEVFSNEDQKEVENEKNPSTNDRATSPYHAKCFPGYCDSAAAADKQTISKMKRADLEDRYLVYADENLTLKRRMKDHEKQIQRLTVSLSRQDGADRKTGVKKAYDTSRADNLESQNKSLQAKIKVLTQQLMNHSHYHSKEHKIAEERRKGSPTNSHRELTQTQSVRSPVRKGEDVKTLKERIAALEQMLEAQRKKYKSKISVLEKELGNKSSADLGDQISQHSKQLSDNLEFIKLKRQNNELVEQIETLKDQLAASESEIKAAQKLNAEKIEGLEEKLKQERDKVKDAEGVVTENKSHTQSIKALEEQIIDLQKQNELLKETNEKLLASANAPESKSDTSLQEKALRQQKEIELLKETNEKLLALANDPESKSDASEQEKALREQISTLEDNNKVNIKALEEKEKKLTEMESLLEQLKAEALKNEKEMELLKETNDKLLALQKAPESKSDASEQEKALRQQISTLEDNLKLNIKESEENEKKLKELESLLEKLKAEALKNEKEMELLKETNEKLLALANAPESNNDTSDQEEALRQQISTLEDNLKVKIKESEENQNKLKEMESLLENLKAEALKKEKEIEQLKETNEKLLALANAPQSKSDTSEQDEALRQQISTLEDNLKVKIKELEEKENKLTEIESLLEQLKAEALKNKKEIELLKETNEKLLALANAAESKSDTSEQEKALRQQISSLEDNLKVKIKELEEKENKLTEMESLLEKLKAEVLNNKKEIELLKETNEKLLAMTTAPQSKSDTKILEKDLRLKISMLEESLKEKIDELEEKEKKLIEMVALLEQYKAAALKNKASNTGLDKAKYNEEIERLKVQLDHALHENGEIKKTLEKMRLQLEEDEQNKDLAMENEKLQQEVENIRKSTSDELNELQAKLAVYLAEIEKLKKQLRDGAGDMVPKSEYDDLEAKFKELLEETKKLKEELDHWKKLAERPPSPSKSSRSTSTTSVLLGKSEYKPDNEEECEDLKVQLHNALLSNEKLKAALENADHGEREVVIVKDDKLEKKLASALSELWRLKQIEKEHEQCPTKPTINANKSKVVIVTEHSSPPPTPVPSIVVTTVPSKAETKLQSYSEHIVEEIPPRHAEKPILVIVSKHEFEAIHLQKQKFYSETDVAVPVDGTEILNCKMEISMHDLEMDKEMQDYVRDIEKDPHVYMDWSFLGLDQRTVAMRPDQAFFNTYVTYFGPLTHNMSEHVKENIMPVNLMLVRGENKGQSIGTGELDLFPAITNPGRGFLRSIRIKGVKGSANVACSFRMHGCCPGEKMAEDTIEVGIGHLKLNNPEEVPEKSTHLYVEYSLLGRCGAELETDSVPKSDVMRFNYTKRLRVHDHNVPSLEPLIQRDTPQPLKFFLLSEPCSLSAAGSEVQEVGTAEVNLREEMIQKDKDIISAQLPVTNKDGDELGTLSVTIIGIDTLMHYTEEKKAEKAR